MLTLAQARTIAEETLNAGTADGMKPLAVIVLDTGGHTFAFLRQDGASPGRFGIAQGKAYGAVMTGMPGSALMARAEQQAYFVQSLNGVFGGKVVPVPGGVLVRDASGTLLGAVGVSGDVSDNDAKAALAGIEAAGLVGEA